MRELVKRVVSRAAPTLMYRRPQSALEPERLYVYLDELYRRRELDGAVVEVGCWVAGTAAVGMKMLRNVGAAKRYVCVDTFGGFVEEQFEHDRGIGAPASRRLDFAASSPKMVRRLLQSWGVPEVELLPADITKLDASRLPDKIALALIDVDLELPTYEALERVVPRLAPGGVALVDDCNEAAEWIGARRGYQRFVDDHGLPATYRLGVGIVSAEA